MALSNRINMRGGGASKFTWQGTSATWDNGITFQQVGVGTKATNTQAPVIPSGCKLYYDITTYQPSVSAQGALYIQTGVGSIQTTMFSQAISAGGSHNYTGVIDLSSYTGMAPLYRVYCENNSPNQTQTITINNFTIMQE